MAGTTSIGYPRAEIADVLLNGKFKNIVTVAKTGRANFVCSDYDSDGECLQAAINSLQSGGVIAINDGEYLISATVYYTEKTSLIGVGNVNITSSIADGSYTFSTDISHYTADTVSISNVAEKDVAITVSSVTGLEVGDFLKISDSTQYDGYNNGEIIRIASIDGLSLTLDKPIQDTYTSTPIYQKIDMFQSIHIRNINFVGPGIETDSNGLIFFGVYNLTISDCKFENWGKAAVNLWDAVSCTILDCVFRNNFFTGLGYSVCLSNACDNINIFDSFFEKKGRHYIATGAGTGTNISNGLIRHVHIRGCTFENSTEEAINTHFPARTSLIIDNCKFQSCDQAVEISNSRDAIISNCICKNCVNLITTYGTGCVTITNNVFNNFTRCYLLGDVNVLGNTFIGTGYINTEISELNLVGGNRLAIVGNVFYNYAGDAIYSYDISDKTYLYINSNTFFSDGTSKFLNVNCRTNTNNPIYLQNNIIVGTVELYNCGNVAITGNSINSTYKGIRILPASGTFLISDNNITSGTNGISLESSGGNTSVITLKNNNITASTSVYNQDGNYTMIDSNENKHGTATITTSSTTVNVTHGLAATPTRVILSPTSDTAGKRYWVSTKAATTFTITIDSAAETDIIFDWEAIV